MEDARAIITKYIKDNQIRVSRQRNQILEIFLSVKGHVNLNELTLLVRKQHPSIGYATVARAMKLFQEAGIAEKSDFGDGASRFEPTNHRSHHDHLCCEKCGEILEFYSPQLENIQNEIAKRHYFKVRRHQLIVFGLCEKCQVKSNQVTDLVSVGVVNESSFK